MVFGAESFLRKGLGELFFKGWSVRGQREFFEGSSLGELFFKGSSLGGQRELFKGWYLGNRDSSLKDSP